MNQPIQRKNQWLWLTAPIAILFAIAAGCGLFISGMYKRDIAYFVIQARGQDMISFAIVLPVLIISAILTGRGSLRAQQIWFGALVYLIYTYIVAAFDVNFNSLFLVYVALLGCSLYALIGRLVSADMNGIKSRFSEKTLVKTVSIYLGVVAVLFYLLWLKEIIPALIAGRIPQSILDNGTPTNTIHVLDMSWMLPAFLIAAFALWRRRALGYTLAGVLLTYAVFLMLAVLSMALFMSWGGYAVAAPQVVIFGVLFFVSLGMLTWYLKGLKSVPDKTAQA